MTKLYMISDPEHPLTLPNYTPSEKDASMASIKGTFAAVEPIDPVDWGQL